VRGRAAPSLCGHRRSGIVRAAHRARDARASQPCMSCDLAPLLRCCPAASSRLARRIGLVVSQRGAASGGVLVLVRHTRHTSRLIDSSTHQRSNSISAALASSRAVCRVSAVCVAVSLCGGLRPLRARPAVLRCCAPAPGGASTCAAGALECSRRGTTHDTHTAPAST
jgi:hypothetical protein